MNSCANGPSASPGINSFAICGIKTKTTAQESVIAIKKIENMESRKRFPVSSPEENLSTKYGRRTEAETNDPIETNKRSGMRNAP